MNERTNEEFMLETLLKEGKVYESAEERREAEAWYEAHREELLADGGSILNNERRHEERQDFANLEMLEGRDEEDEYIDKRLYAVCCKGKDWLERIFTQHWEDLHELVSDKDLCLALKSLTYKQKQVLFWNVIHDYSTAEIATAMGSTERNIRDIRQRALEKIRMQMGFDEQIRYTKLKKVTKIYRKKLK